MEVTPDHKNGFWVGQTGVAIKCSTEEATLTSLSLQKNDEAPNTQITNSVTVDIQTIVISLLIIIN